MLETDQYLDRAAGSFRYAEEQLKDAEEQLDECLKMLEENMKHIQVAESDGLSVREEGGGYSRLKSNGNEYSVLKVIMSD